MYCFFWTILSKFKLDISVQWRPSRLTSPIYVSPPPCQFNLSIFLTFTLNLGTLKESQYSGIETISTVKACVDKGKQVHPNEQVLIDERWCIRILSFLSTVLDETFQNRDAGHRCLKWRATFMKEFNSIYESFHFDSFMIAMFWLERFVVVVILWIMADSLWPHDDDRSPSTSVLRQSVGSVERKACHFLDAISPTELWTTALTRSLDWTLY